MKVLMTADAIGGVWQYALQLAQALEPAGIEVELATMGRAPDAAQRAEARTCRNVALHESTFRLEWMEDCWQDVDAAGDWLLELERSLVPDVVHVNGFVHAALPWRAPVLSVAHSCVLSWWQATHGTPAPAYYDEYRARVARGLSAAATLVAPTRALLDAMRPHYSLPAATTVISNARSPRNYHTRLKEPFVLAAGRLWDPSKNIGALARAAAHLTVPVRVAGPQHGPDGRCMDLPNVELLGTLSHGALAEQYARAAVYALPARYEPFGLSALEAALSGCALVLGDIPTLREVWGDAAVFVPPDDERALAAAISELIQSPTRREALARRSRQQALTYSPARMADAYRNCYAALVSASSRPREVTACAS